MRVSLVMLGVCLATAAYADPAATPAPAPAATAPVASSVGSVSRAVFTSAIADREPGDNLTQIPAGTGKVYYFTELHGLNGQTVTHRWEYQGKVVSEVKFDVHGNRWRVFSNKTLDPAHTGEWKASTVDAQGNVLSVNTFTYGAPAPATAMPTSAPAPAKN